MSLQPDVAGPLDKDGEVPFGLDILSDARILGHFLRQGIDHLLVLLLLPIAGIRAMFFLLAFFPWWHLGWPEERTGFIQSYLLTISLNTEQMFPTLYSPYSRVVQ